MFPMSLKLVKRVSKVSHLKQHKQDNVSVECVPPTWKPYALQFQLPPPDVPPVKALGNMVIESTHALLHCDSFLGR